MRMTVSMSLAMSALLVLAACSAPPAAPSASPAVAAKPPAATPTEAPAPTKPEALQAGQVDATALPPDVQEYIVKQRMCRHVTEKAARGEMQPTHASMLCMAGGNAETWRALIRKYADNDTIGSVLVAEKPLDAGTP